MSRRRCAGPAEEAESAHQRSTTGIGRRTFLAAQERIFEERHAVLERIARSLALATHRLCEEPGRTGRYGRPPTRPRKAAMSAEANLLCWAYLAAVAASLFMMSCSAGNAPNFPSEAESTPAEDSIGERLFLDTRFAQFFATHMTGVNQPLTSGDPAIDLGPHPDRNFTGPVCRPIHQLPVLPLCHGISGSERGGNRTYPITPPAAPCRVCSSRLTTLQEIPCRWWARFNLIPGRPSCTLMANLRARSI